MDGVSAGPIWLHYLLETAALSMSTDCAAVDMGSIACVISHNQPTSTFHKIQINEDIQAMYITCK